MKQIKIEKPPLLREESAVGRSPFTLQKRNSADCAPNEKRVRLTGKRRRLERRKTPVACSRLPSGDGEGEKTEGGRGFGIG